MTRLTEYVSLADWEQPPGALVFAECIPGDKIAVIANGDDWTVADAATKIAHVTPLLKQSKPPGALIGPKTWACVTQLAYAFQGGPHRWSPGPQLSAWITDQLIRRTSTPEWSLETAGWAPMEHQKTGALAIAATGRFYLMDEMGTGKTMTALLGLKLLPGAFPAIVVAPASVVDVWAEEIGKWTPDLSAVKWEGPNRNKCILPDENAIYIMSYGIMRRDHAANKLRWLNARTVVFDEAHFLCNANTLQSAEARRLARKTTNVICLSGTPITNSIGNFWAALNAIEHESWPSRERFKKKFTVEGFAQYGESIEGLSEAADKEFRACLLGTMRRVAKEDVLDLPPKTHQRRTVEIPLEYRTAYDEMREDMLAHLPDNDDPLPAMNTLAQLTRLSQLAAAACDVEVSEEWDEDKQEMKQAVRVTMRMPSWKVDELLEIRRGLPKDEPLVVFSPYKQLTRLAGKALEEDRSHPWRVAYIDGDVTVAKRKPVRIGFQNGEYDALCVTTKAGGLGLTLTRASTSVYLSRPWSLVESSQSEDRTHRKGQDKPVQIIDIVAKDTVDKRVFMGLQEKAAQFSQLVQDPRIVRQLLS